MKKALYVVVGLAVVFLAVAALLPSSYTVERSIVVERSPAVVFPLVEDDNAWLKWSPWPKMEPSAKQTVTGTPGQVGHSWSWEGEELGVGSMTLHAIEPGRSVHAKLVFEEPMQSEADDWVLLEETPQGTKVTWRDSGSLAYPIGRYFGLGLEGMLGPQFEDGLSSLKQLAESLDEPASAAGAEGTGSGT